MAYVAANSMKQITDVFGRRLEKKGVTRIQWVALYYLGEGPALSQKQLANNMNIKESTTVRLIDRLERDGFVKRQKDPVDRRVTSLYLTEKGKSFREDLLPFGEVYNDSIIKGIDEKDLEVFQSVLNKMLANVAETSEEDSP